MWVQRDDGGRCSLPARHTFQCPCWSAWSASSSWWQCGLLQQNLLSELTSKQMEHDHRTDPDNPNSSSPVGFTPSETPLPACAREQNSPRPSSMKSAVSCTAPLIYYRWDAAGELSEKGLCVCAHPQPFTLRNWVRCQTGAGSPARVKRVVPWIDI